MNIIERGQAFRQWLQQLAQRTPWDERQCPHCGQHESWKHDRYTRHPWTLDGRQVLTVQRYWCQPCRRTFVPPSPVAAPRRRYGRDVQRLALDHWLHGGSSLRRTAELVRSWLGHQERWCLWRPLAPAPPPAARCRLEASTVQRWLDMAGRQAQASVPEQLAGVPTSGQVGTDGLWARLRGTGRRVVLLLTDSVSGVVWPPVVTADEDPAAWAVLLARAQVAGLDVEHLRGVTSDGAPGLATYLETALTWVHHQRCVFHIWRNLAGKLTAACTMAAAGLRGAAATATRAATRAVLARLVHAVLDAATDPAAVAAVRQLAAHPLGADLARTLRNEVEAVLVYREPFNHGLLRVGPEWKWRDFRLRLSHGRNHQTIIRLERAALVWALYHNFTPAQWRCERKRRYRRPGQSPLAMTGVPLGVVSYLDALLI
jgi:hypothetical protein